jgi:prepilin-type N-terminal cleavage/methylation domain-containing protein
MITHRFFRVKPAPFGDGCVRTKFNRSRFAGNRGDEGFTLVELLIVVTIIPLIVGALAAGLISVFSLQSGVASRLADTSDAQVVSANFQNDVQSAAEITTADSVQPQCGSGNLLLGLEWNQIQGVGGGQGSYQTVVSYDWVPLTSGAKPTYSLVRENCTLVSGSLVPEGSPTTISYDLPVSATQQNPFAVTCLSTVLPANCASNNSWLSAADITGVTFDVTENNSNYSYNLDAVPASSSSSSNNTGGSPFTNTTNTSCGRPASGSGPLAGVLCLVDFSSLTGNNMIAATQGGCLEMSVSIPDGDTMYFCIGISGAPVTPYSLPTYCQAFLGNSGTCKGSATGVTPNDFNIPGEPALYQDCYGSTASCGADNAIVNSVGMGQTIITITNITLIGPSNIPATGWEFLSVDAESTDASSGNGGYTESITWTSDAKLTAVSNGYNTVNGYTGNAAVDTPFDLVGNACNNGNFIWTGLKTVQCVGNSSISGGKTGAAMIEALTPNSMTVTMNGGGLEGVAFGMLVS